MYGLIIVSLLQKTKNRLFYRLVIYQEHLNITPDFLSVKIRLIPLLGKLLKLKMSLCQESLILP